MKEDFASRRKEERIDEVVNLLTDLLFIDEDDPLTEELMVDKLGELLKKKDRYGKSYFVLDKELNYTEESKELLMNALNRFKEQLDAFEKDGSLVLDENVKERTSEFIKLLSTAVNTDKVIIQNNKMIFATIPTKDGKTVLDTDLFGKNVVIMVGGKEYDLKSPHNYVFIEDRPSDKRYIEHILDELRMLEEATKTGAELSTLVHKKGGLQSEPGAYVKKNAREQTRIPFGKADGVIVIFGVFHKVGDVDKEVQDEYMKRNEVWSKMITDKPDLIMVDGKEAYARFKQRLIRRLYNNTFDEVESVHRYLVSKAYQKLGMGDK